MESRKQVFEERRSMKLHYVEEYGVVFLNFPADVSKNGEVGYDGGIVEVARHIAEQIPEELRSAVTIDMDKIPVWELREKFLEETYGKSLPQEHVPGEATSKLLEIISDSE